MRHNQAVLLFSGNSCMQINRNEWKEEYGPYEKKII